MIGKKKTDCSILTFDSTITVQAAQMLMRNRKTVPSFIVGYIEAVKVIAKHLNIINDVLTAKLVLKEF